MLYILMGEGLDWFCKGENINLLKCLGIKMVSLIWTDYDGLCMLQNHAGVEVGAKIQHCQSCGLRSEQDETEEKQVLLVPPFRIKVAVKYWRILSLPKLSLRLVSYFNSLRVVLKDNLFLIPPCQLKQMVLFPFPPFLPGETTKGIVKRDWTETGACLFMPCLLLIIPCLFSACWTVSTTFNTQFKLIANKWHRNA